MERTVIKVALLEANECTYLLVIKGRKSNSSRGTLEFIKGLGVVCQELCTSSFFAFLMTQIVWATDASTKSSESIPPSTNTGPD